MTASEGTTYLRSFKKAYIEITNACNLACDFCPGTTRAKRYMSREEFQTILTKLHGHVNQLYFHVMGEPCLHPELGTLLDIAEQHGFPVNLTTNGTLLYKHIDSALLEPALRKLSISLHSHACSGEYERYLEEVLAAVKELRAKRQIIISLRLWNNEAGGPNLKNEWVIRRIQSAFTDQPVDMEEWKDSRGIKIAKDLYLNLAEEFAWPDLRREEYGNDGFCHGLRDQIGILCDGTVIPCCLDGEGVISLGNLYTQSLEEIIDSARAKAIYEGFSNRKAAEELCRKCGYRGRFDRGEKRC